MWRGIYHNILTFVLLNDPVFHLQLLQPTTSVCELHFHRSLHRHNNWLSFSSRCSCPPCRQNEKDTVEQSLWCIRVQHSRLLQCFFILSGEKLNSLTRTAMQCPPPPRNSFLYYESSIFHKLWNWASRMKFTSVLNAELTWRCNPKRSSCNVFGG